jgi:hypothetical protein
VSSSKSDAVNDVSQYLWTVVLAHSSHHRSLWNYKVHSPNSYIISTSETSVSKVWGVVSMVLLAERNSSPICCCQIPWLKICTHCPVLWMDLGQGFLNYGWGPKLGPGHVRGGLSYENKSTITHYLFFISVVVGGFWVMGRRWISHLGLELKTLKNPWFRKWENIL